MLTANESLPDIHKGRPLAGELSEKGYDSEKQSSRILRFNDAFLVCQFKICSFINLYSIKDHI